MIAKEWVKNIDLRQRFDSLGKQIIEKTKHL